MMPWSFGTIVLAIGVSWTTPVSPVPTSGSWSVPACKYDKFEDQYTCRVGNGPLGVYAQLSNVSGESKYFDYLTWIDPRKSGDYLPGSHITVRVDDEPPIHIPTLEWVDYTIDFRLKALPKLLSGKTLLIRYYAWPYDNRPIDQKFSLEGFSDRFKEMEDELRRFLLERKPPER